MRNVHIDDTVLVNTAKKVGTPCLCYEEDEIIYWEQQLKKNLPINSKLIYSVKASASPILLLHYIKSGMYFETASDGELSILLSLGADPQKIWVSGQGKTKQYLQNAIENGIQHFHIESEHELELLSNLITENSEKYECCIRINPSHTATGSVLRTAGTASAFGIDEVFLSKIMRKKYANLITGIFIYAGSQYFEAKSIIQNTEYAFLIAKKFYEITGQKIKNIDFGGGFGVPENDDTPELDLDLLHEGLNSLFQKYCIEPYFSENATFYFESGRYLSARTACLVTSIVDIKKSNDKKFIVTDGGINQLGVKQAEYRLFPPYIHHIGKGGHEKAEYCITGTTCTPIDLTHPGVILCTPSIGDYICIPDCGGYSLSFSPQNFNGQYTIPEVLHSKGKLLEFVRRGNYHCLLEQYQNIPTGSGNEIKSLFKASCPCDSDEVQNIVIAATTAKLNKSEIILYDVSADGTQAVILLKILKKHYQIIPKAVFSNFSEISCYTESPCYYVTDYNTCCTEHNSSSLFAMIVGSNYTENDISSAISVLFHSGVTNFMKIESELMTSMEYDFYSYYLHHIPQLQSSFNLIKDSISRQCFLEYLRTVLENDFWRIEQNSLLSKYWGYDILPYKKLYYHKKDEHWLNIGACNGDTIFRFLRNEYEFEHIYATDIDQGALLRCKSNLNLIRDKSILNKISFHNIHFGCGENEIKIDDIFSEIPISLINMDIEGEEYNTIKSASKLIQNKRPVLAICVYHKPEDLYILIKTIHELCKDYIFYLRKYPNYPFHRYNSKEELVLYAIPPERCSGDEL